MSDPTISGDYQNFTYRSQTSFFDEFVNRAVNFEVRESDVWVIGLPRSGATWLQELVWLVGHKYDYRRGNPLQRRFPDFEHYLLVSTHPHLKNSCQPYVDLDRMISPRFIRTQLPIEYLPNQLKNSPYPQIFYIARDATEMFASKYYFHKHVTQIFHGDWMDFLHIFTCEKEAAYLFNHVFYFWERRHEPNVCFVHYRDMHQDLRSVLMRVAFYLNRTIPPHRYAKLIRKLSITNMAVNPDVNRMSYYNCEGFIRNGYYNVAKQELPPYIYFLLKDWLCRNMGSGLYNNNILLNEP